MSWLTQRKLTLAADFQAGFLVFLIALPLCLGISMASNFPPIAGILTAIVGGCVASFLGSSRLTIKGPAAGLIVIALGAVQELGGGMIGYRRALAVGVVAAVIQIVLALLRAGALGTLMPKSVIHGMLAAIGVIIIAKQFHVMLGVVPHAKEPLGLLTEIPDSIMHLNPEIAIIGLLSLLLLFAVPLLKKIPIFGKIPPALIVLVCVIPLGVFFDLAHKHTYMFLGTQYSISPQFLVQLPGNLLQAIQFPDFSQVFTLSSIKYIIMFALVGSIESLLTVAAVDGLDPEKKASDLNRDLLATGIGNLIVAMIGGLPMISEIVRSKANIDQGARTHDANFFHGLFLLLFVSLLPGFLKMIPLAALAAMLVYTGTRLASPSEFFHVYHIGKDQLLYFMVTLVVTLATDLLVGVVAGIALKILVHMLRGASFRDFWRLHFIPEEGQQKVVVKVQQPALFFNFLYLKRYLITLQEDIKEVEIDFSQAHLVDHSFLEKLHQLGHGWEEQRSLIIVGLDQHRPASEHPLSVHRLHDSISKTRRF